MSYQVALVGLPNVGKSSLFNLLSSQIKSVAAPFPFSTIEPLKTIVNFPDKQLDRLWELLLYWFKDSLKKDKLSRKYCIFELIDLAGIVPINMEKEEKINELSAHFLSYIRGVDLILLVIRVFESQTSLSQLNRFLDEQPTVTNSLLNLLSLNSLTAPEREIGANLELEKTREILAGESIVSREFSSENFQKELNNYSSVDLCVSKPKMNNLSLNNSISKNNLGASESILELQLVLLTLIHADLELLDKMVKKYSKEQKLFKRELKILLSIKEELERRRYIPISLLFSYQQANEWEREFLDSLALLSSKKIAVLGNYGSTKASIAELCSLKAWAEDHKFPFCSLNLEGEELFYSLLAEQNICKSGFLAENNKVWEQERLEHKEALFLQHSSVYNFLETIRSVLNLSSFYTLQLVDANNRKYSLQNWSWDVKPISGEVRAWPFSKTKLEGDYLYKCISQVHNQLSEYFVSSKVIPCRQFLNLNPIEDLSVQFPTQSKKYRLQGGELVQVLASI